VSPREKAEAVTGRLILRRVGSKSIAWRRLAEPLRAQYGSRIVDEALDRLDNGDVSETCYGIRVRVRADLGDDRARSGAKAYWPSGDGDWTRLRCLCYGMRRHRVCSHALAALLFELGLEEQDRRMERAG
jgi:hypothetical protein